VKLAASQHCHLAILAHSKNFALKHTCAQKPFRSAEWRLSLLSVYFKRP